MANPQTENGYTPIANEILDNLIKLPLNGTQLRILLTVWRYTYGFSRKDHSLAVGFICKATGLCKRQVQRELHSLISANVLTIAKDATFSSPRRIAFNKNYEEYLLDPSGTDRHQVSNQSPVDKLDPSSTDRHQVSNPTSSQVSNQSPHQVSNRSPKKTNIKTNIKTNAHDDNFENFYSQYPHPKEKQRTLTNWRKAIKEHSPSELIQAAQNYAKTVEGTEKQFIKTSANFLGRDKPYLDYLYQPKETPASREIKPVMFDLSDPDAYQKLYGGDA